MKDLLIGLSTALGLLLAAYLLSLVWYSLPSYENYSSEVQLPKAPEAKLLVEKCLATEGYGDPKFESSWRLSYYGSRAFFRCDVEEKSDWRERSRLDICSAKPLRRYSWEEILIL